MGRIAIDLTGQRFGSLVVVERQGTATGGQAMWKCACDCGGSHVVAGQNLRTGNSTRCPHCSKTGRAAAPAMRATRVDLFFRDYGAEGGFGIATDLDTGNVVMATRLSNTRLMQGHWAWPPLKGLLNRLAMAQRMVDRNARWGLTRWAQASGVAVHPHYTTDRARFDAAWAHAQASGLVPTPENPAPMPDAERNASPRVKAVAA